MYNKNMKAFNDVPCCEKGCEALATYRITIKKIFYWFCSRHWDEIVKKK